MSLLASLFLAASLQAAPPAIPAVKDLNGQPYFALGVNYAWRDWGKDFADAGWDKRYPLILADLDKMRASGVRTLRWWVYTDFVDSPLWTGTGSARRCTGLPKGWVKNFMLVLDAASKRGIRLYPTFSSFDLGRKGFKEVVTDPAVRQSFIDNAVKPILAAAGRHPGVFAWDIINEPEWLVAKEDGGDPNKELSNGPVRLAELRAYILTMAAVIHANAKQPCSVGSACQKWSGGQYDYYSGLGLDFFDVHFYDWMTPWFNITTTKKSSLKLNKEYREKPMIVGESCDKPELRYTGPGKPKDHTRFLQDLIANGYAGYMPWAWNEKADWRVDESVGPHFNQALKTMQLPGLRP